MKITLIILATLLMIGCSQKTKQLDKTENSKVYRLTEGSNPFGSLGLIDYKTKGMHYKVFQTSSGGVTIINVTLDSLQVQKLKKDINNGH